MYVLKTFFLSDRAMIVFEIGDRAKNYSLKIKINPNRLHFNLTPTLF